MTREEYKKQQQDKKDEKNKIIADKFIKAIEEERAPWMKTWKPNAYPYNFNPATNKKMNDATNHYKGINELILTVEREILLNSEDPRWMTFVQVQEMNKSIKDEKDFLFIKKGEHATFIKKVGFTYFDEDGKIIRNMDEPNHKPVAKKKPFSQYHAVFNACQIGKKKYDENGNEEKDENGNTIYIEGLPKLDNPNKQIDFKPNEKIESLLSKLDIKIKNNSYDEAYESGKIIKTVPKENFESENEYYSTILHELTHWTGMEKNLNRETWKNYSKDIETRAKEELVAEIGSYMLSKELEICFEPSENTKNYVKNWCQAIENKPEAIFEAVQAAEQAKDFIFEKAYGNNNTNQNENNDIEVEVISRGKGRK